MANAVLVVDMLVGFLEPGHNLYCGEEARGIIPNIKRLIETEQAKGSKVFFIADNHDPDDLEFKVFPPHCIKGTEESEVIRELSNYEGVYIPKKRYSAFFGTDLEQRLAKLNPEKVIVCGVCTDICVMHTTSDARNRDYVVEVPTNCVASFDEEAHRNALRHMDKILGAKLLVDANRASGSS
ncbi:MAG: cysteine hydrolase [Chloroflexi bacterium]|nr:cysteine hydrolase [Chloroflexota bacterium]